jgi:hypothetical protein
MRLKTRSAVFFFPLLGIILLSAGCASTPTSPAASTAFLPTWIAETVAAGASTTALFLEEQSLTPSSTATPEPTLAATSTLSLMGPSPTASITPTPTLTSLPVQPTRTPPPSPTSSIPPAAVQIQRPGPLSRLVSPLQVQASVRPGPDGRIRLELLGEDGRLLVRQILNYSQATGWVFISEELEFEIRLPSETARLSISAYDSFGRLAWLQAVDVILLSMGQNDINSSGFDREPLIVQEPLPNKLIQGGALLLNGLSRLPDEQLLLIELVTSTGRVVGYRQAAVQTSPDGAYTPFSAEVPYTVEEPTWVRLTVKQDSLNRIPGLVYATSFEVLLSP